MTEEFEEEDVIYNVERMDGELLEKDGALGTEIHMIRIAAGGIEHLYSEGYETILDTETRYEILEILYQEDRKNPGRGYFSREDLIDKCSAGEDEINRNIWYLKETRLVKTMGSATGYFYHRVKITERGSEKYERYEEDGVEIPRVGSKSSLRQASIGPNESGKAENLFRDFVELAGNEIVIIDRFAREGLYDSLKHVPSGVDIKVITTDRVTGGGYQQRVQQFEQQHPNIEVRYLQDSNWDFHDRYVIRDQEDAWAWGHSFHDAGDTQHTASELKPTNRETIIKQFKNAWQNSNVIV